MAEKTATRRLFGDAEPFRTTREVGIAFRRVSPSGEQGFPGRLELKVTYSLTANNDLCIRYAAKNRRADSGKTSPTTPISTWPAMTRAPCSIIRFSSFAKKYVPVDAHAIPTGKILDVAGTPFDFHDA